MIITLNQFEELIEAIRELEKRSSALYDLGIDCMDLAEIYSKPFQILTKAIFNSTQRDYLDWWLYDSPNGVVADPLPGSSAKLTEVGTGALISDLTSAKALYNYLTTLINNEETV